jgi:phosphatidylglycerol lysyltransferase
MSPPPQQRSVLDLLESYDALPESVCLLYEAPWRFFHASGTEGAAAYIESHGVALVWCDPLCAPADRERVLSDLTRELRREGLRICLLIVSKPVAEAAQENGYAVLKIGEQPVFDLGRWEAPRGDPGKHLRWCLNVGRRAGIVASEIRGADERAQLVEVVAEWESALARPASRSFLRTDPLAAPERKRIFVAGREGRIEAFLACAQVNGGRGWFLEDLVRRPTAPVGATELAVVEALARLADGGADWAALDIAPLRGSVDQLDRRARRLMRAARPALGHFDTRYHFRARSQYAAKFAPSEWRPRYVALLPTLPTLGLFRAVRSSL